MFYHWPQEGNMDPNKLPQKRISKRGKVAINFDVEPELWEKLRKLAIQEDRSISAVLRRIVLHHFADAGI